MKKIVRKEYKNIGKGEVKRRRRRGEEEKRSKEERIED